MQTLKIVAMKLVKKCCWKMMANYNEATQGKCEQSVYEMSQCMKYITTLVGV